MTNTIQNIPLLNLAIGFIPALAVILILVKWSLNASTALYAMLRMLIQLLIIGYFLAYIFETEQAWIILLILIVMVLASSWIALGTVKTKRCLLYKHAFLSTVIGGGITLALVTQGVLVLEP